MNIGEIVVFVLLAAIVVPVAMAEIRRRRNRPPAARPARAPQREPAAKPPLRLVVNKNDMDRELAALLAKDNRKSTERDD